MSGHEQEEAVGDPDGDSAAEHHHEGHNNTTPLSSQQHSNETHIITNDDPCCQGAVNRFNTLAKVAPQTNHFVLLAPFTYVAAYYLFF
jgi:hypothetical protein